MPADTVFTTTELVYLPSIRVWDLLTDWAAVPAWVPGISEMHAEGPAGVGTTLEYHSQGHDRRLTVTEFEPGRRLTLSSGHGDVHTEYRFDLQDDGDDTRLTFMIRVEVAPSLSGIASDIRSAIIEADAGQLSYFKRYAEKAP
jgi:carbon monoxide dehydrogenase subunit G